MPEKSELRQDLINNVLNQMPEIQKQLNSRSEYQYPPTQEAEITLLRSVMYYVIAEKIILKKFGESEGDDDFKAESDSIFNTMYNEVLSEDNMHKLIEANPHTLTDFCTTAAGAAADYFSDYLSQDI